MKNVIYNVTKDGRSTVITGDDGSKSIINKPKDFYILNNIVVVVTCEPEIKLRPAVDKVGGVATTTPTDVITKLVALKAFNPYA